MAHLATPPNPGCMLHLTFPWLYVKLKNRSMKPVIQEAKADRSGSIITPRARSSKRRDAMDACHQRVRRPSVDDVRWVPAVAT